MCAMATLFLISVFVFLNALHVAQAEKAVQSIEISSSSQVLELSARVAALQAENTSLQERNSQLNASLKTLTSDLASCEQREAANVCSPPQQYTFYRVHIRQFARS